MKWLFNVHLLKSGNKLVSIECQKWKKTKTWTKKKWENRFYCWAKIIFQPVPNMDDLSSPIECSIDIAMVAIKCSTRIDFNKIRCIRMYMICFVRWKCADKIITKTIVLDVNVVTFCVICLYHRRHHHHIWCEKLLTQMLLWYVCV